MKFAEYQDMLPSEMLETVRNIHAELLAMGFTEEIKEAKNNPILSYTKNDNNCWYSWLCICECCDCRDVNYHFSSSNICYNFNWFILPGALAALYQFDIIKKNTETYE